MNTRHRVVRSLAIGRAANLDLFLLATGTTLILLQAFRVFMPYLVFEIDQSERVTLARIALTVFALTFLGALLFRLVSARWTIVIAVGALAIARLGIQFSESPGLRWRLGAAAIVASLWLLIVILPSGGRTIGTGIGFAFVLDLILRSLRGTLDLPWMPGWPEDLVTLAIVAAIAFTAYALIRSDSISLLEGTFANSARYIGIGSGLALWLVTAGTPGFAELQSELDLPGAFALLAIGALLALLADSAWSSGWISTRHEWAESAVLGLIGALAALTWWGDWSRWIDLIAVPIFAFVVSTLTMQCATAPDSRTVPGRWRTGAMLTLGLLLQAGFIFLYFARTGPMQLLLAPIAVLTIGACLASRSSPIALPGRIPLARAVTAAAAVAALLTFGWLLWDEPSPSITSAEAADLTVVTFNIQEGFSNENIWSLEETAKTIESFEPDIVILQEITRGWLVMSSADQVRWLADRLNMDYAFAGNSYDELWGNAILSRLPIVSTDSVTFSTTDNLRRSALSVEVETLNGNLLVIDTHLDNPFEATEVRLQQIDELIEFWGGTTPAIIAGDFNADPGSAEWQAMIDAGLIDSGDGTTETTSEDERRIDYIFVTPDVKVDAFTVPDVWVSDHRPVVVELSLSP